MSDNNIDININTNVDEKALAASLEAFSSGLIGVTVENFYKAIIDYIQRETEKETSPAVDSASGEKVEMANGVKFTWEQ